MTLTRADKAERWRVSTNPQMMARWVDQTAGHGRRKRLFVCACLRLLPPDERPPPHDDADPIILDVVRRESLEMADGGSDRDVLTQFANSAEHYHAIMSRRATLSGRKPFRLRHWQQAPVFVLTRLAAQRGFDQDHYSILAAVRAAREARVPHRDLANLLRCIFWPMVFYPQEAGLPHGDDRRAVALWNQQTVPRLAGTIYRRHAFEDLPVLADAAEDAGCDHAELLGHLRHPGPHDRGCWAVDWLDESGPRRFGWMI